MKLGEIQEDFQRIVLGADCVGSDWVRCSDHRLSSQDRIGIYHNAYRVRLIDVLLDTFEHTATYLGDDWFHRLASTYVQAHQSVHKNIGTYGLRFPQFLAEQLAEDLEVSELALMDWRLRRAFDGPDSPIMTAEDLQQLATDTDNPHPLRPVPTLSIDSQHFNTLDIWHAIDQDRNPPAVERLQEPVDVLVWRKGHSPHFRSLSGFESAAIGHIKNGCTLDALGEALGKDFPDVDIVNEVGVLLIRWIEDQLLAVDR